MTRAEAAKSLHISETALKQACRKLGITSWPRQAARRQVQTVADDAARSAKIIDSNSRARSATPCRADSVCAGRQELKRERGGGFLGCSCSFPSNSECSQEMSSVFQQRQEEEEETPQNLEVDSSSQPASAVLVLQ